MKTLLIILLAFTLQQDALIGLWVTEANDLIVECYKQEGKYYGKIKWFKDDNPKKVKYSEDGIPKHKWRNYVVMSDFVYSDGKWEGKIFDVKHGKEYDAIIEKNNDRIIVTGYVLFPIFGPTIRVIPLS